MNWTRLLLKCLATKKTIQQPTLPLLLPPQFPDSYKKNFREIIFTKNLLFSLINVLLRKKINLQSRLFFLDRKLFLRYYYYPPPKTAHLIFHILQFYFSPTTYSKRRISYPLHNILTTFYVKSKSPHLLQSRQLLFCDDMFQFKKREEIFILINSECPKVPYLQNKKYQNKKESSNFTRKRIPPWQ